MLWIVTALKTMAEKAIESLAFYKSILTWLETCEYILLMEHGMSQIEVMTMRLCDESFRNNI